VIRDAFKPHIRFMAGVATIAGLIVKNAPRCIRRTHDHHVKDSSARLGPVKALRFASPRARAAGLDRASIEPLLGSYVMVVVLCDHTLATLR
jgi:hypothetical protein